MKSTDEYLKAPEKTLGWARKALLQLEPAIEAYFRQDGFVVPVTEFDPETGEKVYKLKITKAVSEDIEEHSTNALLHSKHGLDQCVFNASRALGKDLVGNVYFPWSTSPRDMEGKLRRADVPKELWGAIASHAPYKRSDSHAGGDDVIRCLATLANDKHTIGLQPMGRINQMKYPSIAGQVQSLRVLYPVWDASKNEIEIVRYVGEAYIEDNYTLSCQIVIAQPGLSNPVNAVGALSAFVNKAHDAYERIRAKCVEVRGA